MRTTLFSLTFACVTWTAVGFVPTAHLSPSGNSLFHRSSFPTNVCSQCRSLHMSTPSDGKDFKEKGSSLSDSVSKLAGDISIDSIISNAQSAVDNMQEGQFGQRGEAYFAAQVFLVLCILGGGVPVIGGPLNVIFGPLLIVVGSACVAAGLSDIGDNLTPWPAAVTNADLKTTGIFAYVRHPIYAGLLGIMLGGSIATDSASRVILTGILYYVMCLKTDYEEAELIEKFPAYLAYKEEVPGKFVPDQVTSSISSSLSSLASDK